MSDRSWVQRAACRGMDPDMFFSNTGDYPDEAWAACARCPVTTECLEEALRLPESGRLDYGLRASTTARDRRQIRRQRRKNAA